MSTRLDAAVTALASHPLAVGLGIAAVTIAGAVTSVLLREKCGACGARPRVPLAAHWLVDHAGEEL